MKNYVKNRNSVRWFNEKYADLPAEELIERYNRLFGKDTTENKFVKLFFTLKRK
jgi:ribosomal protein S17E